MNHFEILSIGASAMLCGRYCYQQFTNKKSSEKGIDLSKMFWVSGGLSLKLLFCIWRGI